LPTKFSEILEKNPGIPDKDELLCFTGAKQFDMFLQISEINLMKNCRQTKLPSNNMLLKISPLKAFNNGFLIVENTKDGRNSVHH
jgi:hypothetical protein